MVKQHNAKLTEIEKAAREAVRDAAKEVLKQAKKNTPKDSGALRKSGRVLVDDVNVRVVFRSPHAWIQHERLDYEHDDGGPKYLERAVDEVDPAALIVKEVGAKLK